MTTMHDAVMFISWKEKFIFELYDNSVLQCSAQDI